MVIHQKIIRNIVKSREYAKQKERESYGKIL